MFRHSLLLFAGLIALCQSNAHNEPRSKMYSTSSHSHPIYSCLITLSKPGEGCDLHPAYPNTMQCAETRRCIAFNQYKNGKCDCCGPDVDCATCYDHSDENRVEPPGKCQHHPHYKLGLTFQCATRPEICLSRLTDWNNARCDCCPEVDGDCCHANCTDHSDEECMANEWQHKFTCDGLCISLAKLNDSEPDCSYHCVESNKQVREACEASRMQRDQKDVENRCAQMKRNNIPYYKCPSGTQKCIPLDAVRDNKPDCEHGEDDDPNRHPRCDAKTQADKCDSNTSECIAVDKGKQHFCRCKKGEKNCNSVQCVCMECELPIAFFRHPQVNSDHQQTHSNAGNGYSY